METKKGQKRKSFRTETSTKGHVYYREPKASHGQHDCPGNGKTISGKIADAQMDSIINSLILVPDWKDRIIERLSTVSKRQNILTQRRAGKLRSISEGLKAN